MENIGIYQVILKKKYFNKDDLQKYKDYKIRETKTRFYITHIKKSYFESDNFLKKNYKEYIVIYGLLKDKHKHLQGAGIFDFVKEKIQKVKNYFSPRLDSYNNATTKYIQMYGDIPIMDIFIYRTPLDSLLNKAINVLSLGQWSNLQSKYGFDKFYHLALVLRLQNNKNIIVEKLDVVSVSDSYKTNSKTENMKVEEYQPTTLTLNDLLNNARSGLNDDKLFFGYDPLHNNCQYFIKYLLEYSGLYSQQAQQFLFQDISKLAQELNPITKRIMKGTTDLAATINKVMGKGNEKNKKN
jgi:hypothetical protein